MPTPGAVSICCTMQGEKRLVRDRFPNRARLLRILVGIRISKVVSPFLSQCRVT